MESFGAKWTERQVIIALDHGKGEYSHVAKRCKVDCAYGSVRSRYKVVYFDMFGIDSIHVPARLCSVCCGSCLGDLRIGTVPSCPKMNSLSMSGGLPYQSV